MEKEYNRYYIKIRTFLGIQPVAIHEELKQVLGEAAPAYNTVAKWAKEFREGRVEVKDDPRVGRPVTENTLANIELVRGVIIANPHATYNEIEAETSLSRGTIFRIIHEELNFRKIVSRWVPYNLTDENRQERVQACQENLAYFRDGSGRLCNILTGDETWIFHRQIGRKSTNASWVADGQGAQTIVRRDRFEPKTMFSIFFRTTGTVLVQAKDRGETIDHTYYINNCLAPAFDVIIKQRKQTGLKSISLLHDNATPHRHSEVHNFLRENGVKIIRHPPYSPDLAPCDFWLFDYIKSNLGDYQDQRSLLAAVTRIVSDISPSEYHKTFAKWIERMELCVKHGGDYFEHLIK